MKRLLYCKAVLIGAVLLITACSSGDGPDPNPASQLKSGDIATYAGQGPSHSGYDGDGGKATAAQLDWITGIAVDQSGNVYITGGASNTLRKIEASNQTIATLSGTFLGFNVPDPTPNAGDGGPAASAHLNIPLATAIDGTGNIYIADAANNVIRKISASNGTISTFVNNHGFQGYDGDGGPALDAKIFNPYSLAVDAAGNLYFADAENNAIRIVTKATGVITTLAGQGPDGAGYSGDNGPANGAKLNSPFGVAVDTNGNIYISDGGNNVIRKIDGSGTITTIAGTGDIGYTGDGGPAEDATFSYPKGIAVDVDGNVFVADAGNSVVRKISQSTGVIATYAGNGTAGYTGDGGVATAAQLSNPLGVAIDAHANLYIADSNNSAIRIVAP